MDFSRYLSLSSTKKYGLMPRAVAVTHASSTHTFWGTVAKTLRLSALRKVARPHLSAHLRGLVARKMCGIIPRSRFFLNGAVVAVTILRCLSLLFG